MKTEGMGCTALAIDLHDPQTRSNPYPVYSWLRACRPVCRVQPGGLWALSRHSDIKRALRDHRAFSSVGYQLLFSPDWFPDPSRAGMLIAKDPPDHTRLRAFVAKAFTPGVVDALVPGMERSARELVQGFAGRPAIELLEDFSFPYVSRVISRIIGFDPDIHPMVRRWWALSKLVKPTPPPQEKREEIRCFNDAMLDYSREVIAERRTRPRGDLISHLVSAEVGGERLNELECLSMVRLLIGAGFDTTVNLLSNCLRQLSVMPELVGMLRGESAAIPAFIEEVLRFDPPTHAVLRQTKQTVQLAGVKLPAGTELLLLLGSAGRDGRHYHQPERFDIGRRDNDHLAFGYGIHSCIGMRLARLQVDAALRVLLEAFEGFSCPPAASLDWHYGLASRGVRTLPLTLQLRV